MGGICDKNQSAELHDDKLISPDVVLDLHPQFGQETVSAKEVLD